MLAMLLSSCAVLFGCAKSNEEPEQSESESQTESATDSESESTGAEASDDYFALSQNGVALYDFVYQTKGLLQNMATEQDYKSFADTLIAALKSKCPDVKFNLLKDTDGASDKRIFAIGKIEGVSDEACRDLRALDYMFDQSGDNLFLVGYTTTYVKLCVDQLVKSVKEIDGDVYLKASVIGESRKGSYHLGKLTLGDTPVSEYVISYGEDNEAGAKQLAEMLRTESGFIVPCEKNSTAEKVIVLDNTAEDGYQITVANGKMTVSYAPTALQWNLLYQYVQSKIKVVDMNGSFDLASLVTETAVATPKQSLLSFNVKDVWNANGTPGTRDDVCAEMVLEYKPDFLCLQEFDVGYRTAENGLISKISEEYAEVAISGVADVREIWNPIFYRKDLYTVVESGFVYFPDETSSSKESANYPFHNFGDGNSRFRSLVWAVLQDTSGAKYVIGSTHLSYLEQETSQPAEATLVINTIKGVAGRYENATVLVAGDFNSRVSAPGLGSKKILDAGFEDTYTLAALKNDYGTSHDMGVAPDMGYLNGAIDHVFTLRELTVHSFLVLVEESLWPISDHSPIFVQFSAKE